MKIRGFVLTVAALLTFGVVFALAAEKPGEPFAVVSSEELKAMIDSMEPGLVLIDTRSNEEFQEAHIKGAISIPWSSLERDRAVLRFPVESKLVFYCSGLA